MEVNGVLLCDNLIKWLQTLDLKAKHGNPSGNILIFSFKPVLNIRESIISRLQNLIDNGRFRRPLLVVSSLLLSLHIHGEIWLTLAQSVVAVKKPLVEEMNVNVYQN